MVIFALDQVPEMGRGRGVRLQRYKEKAYPTLRPSRRMAACLGSTVPEEFHVGYEGTKRLARQPRRRRPYRAKGFPKNNKFRSPPSGWPRHRR
jgi:topoisomerase-4 subunit A